MDGILNFSRIWIGENSAKKDAEMFFFILNCLVKNNYFGINALLDVQKKQW
jgi:hypothetical protein